MEKREISKLWFLVSVYVHIVVSCPDDDDDPNLGSKLAAI
jgi:hypothetical protein